LELKMRALHWVARPLAVPSKVPEPMAVKATGLARASCHLVLVGEAVEAAPDKRSRDSGRDGRRLQLRNRLALAAPAAGPLAADVGEAVGVNSQGACLPPSLGHDGAEAACRRARTTVSRRTKRKPVDQPRLAAAPAPLPVAARASIGMWSKAVVDRPNGPGWRRVSSPWLRERGAPASCAAARRGRRREAGRLHRRHRPAAACYRATGVASPVH
jgi:hypothetical protein